MQKTEKIAYMRNIDGSEISQLDNGENCEATNEVRNNKQTFGDWKAREESVARCETNVTSATFISSLWVSGSRFQEGARNCVAVTVSRIITTHELT